MILYVPLAIGWFGAILLAPLDGRRKGTGLLALFCLLAMLTSLIVLMRLSMVAPVESVTGGWASDVGISFRADPMGVLFGMVSIAMLASALTFEIGEGIGSRSFPALVVFLGTGLTGLFLTADLFNFYVFFELSMVASFGIACYGGGRREVRAAVLFVVVNLLGTVSFLLGIAGFYHLTGRLDFDGLRAATAELPRGSVLIVATLIFISLGLKVGVFPFHSWLPPVYRSTHSVVAAILGGILANIGMYGLLRLSSGVLPEAAAMGRTALLIVGVASILYGGLVAVARNAAPEILAYSAIGQVGYAIIAIGVGGAAAYQAAIVYALANSINKTLLFLTMEVRGEWGSGAFVTGAASVAGIPPSIGFIAKLVFFLALLEQRQFFLLGCLVAGTALSFLYMFHGYDRVFEASKGRRHRGSVLARAVIAGLSAAILVLGIWPEPLLRASARAASMALGIQ